MSAVRPTCFCRPDFLRKLRPSTVMLLFSPYSDYLRTRGVVIPLDLDDTHDFTNLGLVLADHRHDTPPSLVEELEVLELFSSSNNLLSFEEDHAELVKKYRAESDTLDDVAVKILRAKPEIVWREFDRQAVKTKRSFVSYNVSRSLPVLPVTDDRLHAVEAKLAPWFAQEARSDACRVRAHRDENGISFLVRHGDLLNRIGVIENDGTTRSHLLRPERLDIIHYRRASHEWKISGVGNRLQDEYRKAFGFVFHSTANALAPSRRYTLDPLKLGPACLQCPPNGPVSMARLAAVTLESPAGQEIEVKKGDVFATIVPMLQANYRPVVATIVLTIIGRRPKAKFMICPERNSITGDSNIPAVESWIENAEFAIVNESAELLEIA
ncbi:MAG: hypothetical protein WCS31_10655 [Verrucomicrobiae bacterium]